MFVEQYFSFFLVGGIGRGGGGSRIENLTLIFVSSSEYFFIETSWRLVVIRNRLHLDLRYGGNFSKNTKLMFDVC